MVWEGEGPFFEDFEVGLVIRHWPGRTVYKFDNLLWSAITLDYTPLYIDENYAAYTKFGGPIINPRLLHELVVGITTKDTSINTLAFLGIDYERFVKPVYPGDTIYVESEVVDVKESKSRPNVGIVAWVHRAYNQKGEPVYEVRRSNLVYKRDHAPWTRLVRGEEVSAGGEDVVGHLKARPSIPSFTERSDLIHKGWFGRSFEDFAMGEVIIHRLGRTVYQFDNILATLMTDNVATLHFDAEYMLYHEYGKPVVLGPLVVGIGCGISSIDLTMNLAYDVDIVDLKLMAPVFDGDTLHARSEVLNVEEDPKDNTVGVVTVRTTIFKDLFKTQVARFTRKLAVYKRQHSPRWKIWKV